MTLAIRTRMQIYVAAALLVASTTVAGCSSREASAGSDSIRDVDVAAAAQLIAADDSVVVLDIRTPEEFARGHIEGAVNIDYMADDFAKKLAMLDRNRTYLMHCQSGGRSGKSLAKFTELGFKSVLHLEAGFAGWQSAGRPVEE